MGGLTLPFKQSLLENENAFEIDITSGGGTAIQGNSFGTDQFGDPGTGIGAESDVGTGVYGQSQSGDGVFGTSATGAGIHGSGGRYAGRFEGNVLVVNDSGQAITATSQTQDAVNGTCASPQYAGVSANNTALSTGVIPSGFALWASSNATAIFSRGNPAAYHEAPHLW